MEQPEQRGAPGVLVLVMPLLLAWLVAVAIAVSNNTLVRHPWWHSSKEELARVPMGALSTVTTRNLLSRNRLNLNVWHGFQELSSGVVESATRFRCNFKLANDGYLYLLLDAEQGFRFSNHDQYPNAFVRLDGQGGFLEQEFYQPHQVKAGWHQLEVEWGEDLVFVLDGLEICRQGGETLTAPSLSFRCGNSEVIIDDMEWSSGDGTVLRSETWELPPAWGLGLVSALLLSGLAWGVFRCSRRLVRLQAAVFLLLLSYLAFDGLYWSAHYPYAGYTPWGMNASLHPFEAQRAKLSRLLSVGLPTPRRPRLAKTPHQVLQLSEPDQMPSFPAQAPDGGRWDNQRRILLLGSSQTYGSGAGRLEETLGHQLQRGLPDSVVLNTAASGANLRSLLTDHEKHLRAFRPQLVLANLGNNDAYDWDQLKAALDDLVELNEQYGAATVLSLEPNSLESVGLENLESYHSLMKKWSQERGIRCLELHQHLLAPEQRDSGILWWDQVHLTSHGQRLAGQFLGQALRL